MSFSSLKVEKEGSSVYLTVVFNKCLASGREFKDEWQLLGGVS